MFKTAGALGVTGVTLILTASASGCSSGQSEADTRLKLIENSPTTKPYGKTYGEWGASWWRWYYTLPAEKDGQKCPNPAADATGELCTFGQSGDVFYLAGTQGGNADRTKCVVPRGKALFFPIITFVADNGGVLPADLKTETQLKEAVDVAVMQMTDVTLKLDGVSIDTSKLRTGASKFDYTLPPEPNYYSCAGAPGVTGQITPAFAGGYHALVAPPSPGIHEVEFSGRQNEFRLHVRYQFRVE